MQNTGYGGAADGHRRGDLVELDLVEEDVHVGGRVDRHPAVADLAEAARVVGVAAHQGRHVEGHAQPAPAPAEDHLVALVGLLGVAEPGELPDRPGPPAVAGGVEPTRVGELPGPLGVLGAVGRLDLHPGEGGEVGVAHPRLECLVVPLLPALRVRPWANTRTSY